MAARRQQAEDPWSGFVDVLSNVVMVVTFLVIILGLAMFALSQQVAKSMAAEMLKSEESRAELRKEIDRAPLIDADRAATAAHDAAMESLRDDMQRRIDTVEEARGQAEARARAATAEIAALRESVEDRVAEAEAAASAAAKEEIEGSEGRNRFTLDRPLLQADEVEGNTELTVRSRRIREDFETIVASAEEEADETGTTRVEESSAMLKVAYAPSLYKIDADTTARIAAFLEKDGDAQGGAIELRTFASSSIGSVSEARRIAYYRAMTVRGIAVAAGYDPARIKIALRESEREEDADTVWVIARPR